MNLKKGNEIVYQNNVMPHKGGKKEELGLMVCAAAIDLLLHLAGNESQHHNSHSF